MNPFFAEGNVVYIGCKALGIWNAIPVKPFVIIADPPNYIRNHLKYDEIVDLRKQARQQYFNDEVNNIVEILESNPHVNDELTRLRTLYPNNAFIVSPYPIILGVENV